MPPRRPEASAAAAPWCVVVPLAVCPMCVCHGCGGAVSYLVLVDQRLSKPPKVQGGHAGCCIQLGAPDGPGIIASTSIHTSGRLDSALHAQKSTLPTQPRSTTACRHCGGPGPSNTRCLLLAHAWPAGMMALALKPRARPAASRWQQQQPSTALALRLVATARPARASGCQGGR